MTPDINAPRFTRDNPTQIVPTRTVDPYKTLGGSIKAGLSAWEVFSQETNVTGAGSNPNPNPNSESVEANAIMNSVHNIQSQMGGISDEVDKALKMITGSGDDAIETIIKMWSTQTRAWSELLNNLYGLSDIDPNKAFEEITGINPASPHSSDDSQAIVLANKPVETSLHWSEGVPGVELQLMGMFSLTKVRKSAQADLTVNFRLSLDGQTQVVDINIGPKVPAGTYSGIIFSDGKNYGQISLVVPVD